MDSTPNAPRQGSICILEVTPQEGFERNQARNNLLPQIAQNAGS
jgi:hypothetical protein